MDWELELKAEFDRWWNDHPGILPQMRDLLYLAFEGGAGAHKGLILYARLNGLETP